MNKQTKCTHAYLHVHMSCRYQGESNCLKGDVTIYKDKTLALASGWRAEFQQPDLPLLTVQLAPFSYVTTWPDNELSPQNLPAFMEAQLECCGKTGHVPNCEIVIISDLAGDDFKTDIHPINKRDVGHRLARLALASEYRCLRSAGGVEKQGRGVLGPRLASCTYEHGVAKLTFAHAGDGLCINANVPLGERSDRVTQFQVAGQDRVFAPAQARIMGTDSLEVSNMLAVPDPLYVRYAWHETALGNLANRDGLPASAFRTDR